MINGNVQYIKVNLMKNKQEVIQWGADKGILSKATPMSQAIKTLSEVEELLRAINSGDKEETKDAYGDILVTIILGAELSGMDIEDCLQSAYDIISKRTGKMINGQFVKDKAESPSVYCIEVTRDSEEPFVFHTTFNTPPSRQDILNEIEDQEINYDDNYGKVNYYKVS